MLNLVEASDYVAKLRVRSGDRKCKISLKCATFNAKIYRIFIQTLIDKLSTLFSLSAYNQRRMFPEMNVCVTFIVLLTLLNYTHSLLS